MRPLAGVFSILKRNTNDYSQDLLSLNSNKYRHLKFKQQNVLQYCTKNHERLISLLKIQTFIKNVNYLSTFFFYFNPLNQILLANAPDLHGEHMHNQ